MKVVAGIVLLVLALALARDPMSGKVRGRGGHGNDTSDVVSYMHDVDPIIRKYCLPCHAEDNYNPSELSLDSYEQLMAGGKHGAPIVPGKSSESILLGKLSMKPPFGDPMPLKRRRDPEQKKLTDEMLKAISDWIDQGAKNN